MKRVLIYISVSVILLSTLVLPCFAYSTSTHSLYYNEINGTPYTAEGSLYSNKSVTYSSYVDQVRIEFDQSDGIPLFSTGYQYVFSATFYIEYSYRAKDLNIYPSGYWDLIENYSESKLRDLLDFTVELDIGSNSTGTNKLVYDSDLHPSNIRFNYDNSAVYYHGSWLKSSSGFTDEDVASNRGLCLFLTVDYTFNLNSTPDRVWLICDLPKWILTTNNSYLLFNGLCDLSQIVGFDYSVVTVINQSNEELLSALDDLHVDIQQFHADYINYSESVRVWMDKLFNDLLAGYDGSDLDNGFGILYNIYDLDLGIMDQLVSLNGTASSINTYINQIRSTVNRIYTLVSNIQALLSGTNTTFYDFLDENFEDLNALLIEQNKSLSDTSNSTTYDDSDFDNVEDEMFGDFDPNSFSQGVEDESPDIDSGFSSIVYEFSHFIDDTGMPFLSAALMFSIFSLLLL